MSEAQVGLGDSADGSGRTLPSGSLLHNLKHLNARLFSQGCLQGCEALEVAVERVWRQAELRCHRSNGEILNALVFDLL